MTKLIPGKLYKPIQGQKARLRNARFHKEGELSPTCRIANYPFVLYIGEQQENGKAREYWFLDGNGEKLALWEASSLLEYFERIG